MYLYLEDDYEPSESLVGRLKQMYNDDYLMHLGVSHDHNPPGPGSGRYRWGSGERPNQRYWDLYSRVQKAKAAGFTETQIAIQMGFVRRDRYGNPIRNKDGEYLPNTSELRAQYQIAKDARLKDQLSMTKELIGQIDPDTGKPYTNAKIGEIVGRTEGWVRQHSNMTEDDILSKDKTNQVVNQLKELIDSGEYIDVGRGAELTLGCSKDRLNTALEILKEEGYNVYNLQVNQVGTGPGQKTTIQTLCKPGADFTDAVEALKDARIKSVEGIDNEDTATRLGIREPNYVDLSRVDVKYKEDGGDKKDGVVEIRAIVGEDGKLYPATPDLSLGNAKYAQVRIAVDGGDELGARYIKGMAVYNTDLPDDVDIRVNSNKSASQGLDAALKKMNVRKDADGNIIGVDMDNPFGSTVFQTEYEPGKLSAINVVGDVWGKNAHVEGSWDEWSRNLPSQFLGKQSEELIKQQLKVKIDQKKAEYDEIMAVENPTVRRQLLLDFAEECDGAAVDLKAAPLPGQRVQVLLPLTTVKDNEVYAPKFENGTQLALVRFPHAGTFEIPIVKVNNNIAEAKAFLEDARGQAQDAIGISKATADVLSGADFDGDTAIAIPMSRKNSQGEFVRTTNIKGIGNGATKLPGMENFSPTDAYPGTDEKGNPLPGVKLMNKKQKGTEMGKVSNLITDMQLKGCDDPDQLSRAVKYSMVVIDAEKHKLNYLQAKEDYRIQELVDEYQSKPNGKSGGASTILSMSSGDENVVQRKAGYKINPDTGEKIYELEPNRFYTDKNGNIVQRTQKSTKMAEAKDARELLSDNPSNKELIYADYANQMKAMANSSRKEYMATPKLTMNPEARKEYAEEVAELKVELNNAKKNAPRERQAQMFANQTIAARRQENPDMSDEEYKKLRGQSLNAGRDRAGALKQRVTFTDEQVKAINAGAISDSMLSELLKNSSSDHYRQVFTPNNYRVSNSTATMVKSLISNGWTREQIVEAGYASMATIEQVEHGNYDH